MEHVDEREDRRFEDLGTNSIAARLAAQLKDQRSEGYRRDKRATINNPVRGGIAAAVIFFSFFSFSFSFFVFFFSPGTTKNAASGGGEHAPRGGRRFSFLRAALLSKRPRIHLSSG
jgi:hypothetical protein